MRTINLGVTLLKEIVESPSLKTFKTWLHSTLDNLTEGPAFNRTSDHTVSRGPIQPGFCYGFMIL